MSKRRLVPEVIQSSAMDCGPAALKALCEGFGIGVSYGRLREACQTDVDGTSISTLEEVANELGLEADEIMLPVDQILLPGSSATPAIVVVQLPSGFTHFVVVWGTVGPFVQVMDPAAGRLWMTREQFLGMVYRHAHVVPAEDWLEWATDEENLAALGRRLDLLGIESRAREAIVERARKASTWREAAAVDAALRMVDAICRTGTVRRGRQATGLLEETLARAEEAVPPVYWSVQATPDDPEDEDGEQIVLRGAVLLAARGRKEAGDVTAPRSRELAAALAEVPPRPIRDLWSSLRADGLFAPLSLVAALAVAALVVIGQAVCLRALIDLGRDLSLARERAVAAGALVGLLGLGLGLDALVARGSLALGHALELRTRMRFFAKLPRLGDRYFGSRLVSDMAERSHSLHLLRSLPSLGRLWLRAAFQLLFTTAALIWLNPSAAPLVLATAVCAFAVPLAAQPVLAERDLAARSHLGGLSRYYLDALRGVLAIRAYAAELPVRREHEEKLAAWGGSVRSFQRASIAFDGLTAVLGFGLAAALVFVSLDGAAAAGGVLLLAYWALQLPALGEQLALATRRYPMLRNVALRIAEPLGAPEEVSADGGPAKASEARGPVALALEGASVEVGGHRLLDDVTLRVEPGSHVAIVGVSGAGKSSLLRLLLGLHPVSSGRYLVDGSPADATAIARLRRTCVWIDPDVMLWNRPLLGNLRYGNADSRQPIGEALESADLLPLLDQLPDGLQTPLGEGGGLVSGGEGQRVRLGRAMLRDGVRLAVLDEAFRGLDRERRRRLTHAARTRWARATLLCATHDIEETLAFDRVLVVRDGRVVEDGEPGALATDDGSELHRILTAARRLREAEWGAARWRRVRLYDGVLHEEASGVARVAGRDASPGAEDGRDHGLDDDLDEDLDEEVAQ